MNLGFGRTPVEPDPVKNSAELHERSALISVQVARIVEFAGGDCVRAFTQSGTFKLCVVEQFRRGIATAIVGLPSVTLISDFPRPAISSYCMCHSEAKHLLETCVNLNCSHGNCNALPGSR